MRPHPRRTRTDPSSPRAWATDDRSGFVGNQENLRYQYEWAGTQLINTRILCFEDELDEPQRQLGTIVLPPDPPPITNARPENYAIDEVWPMLMEAATSPHSEVSIYFENSTASGTQLSDISLALETSTIA